MFAASKTDSVSAAGPDGQFNYVTMLLHGDGTNGAQNNTFVDSSTNNFSITRTGTGTQGSFTPYGNNWSNFFLNTGNANRLSWTFFGSPQQAALAGTNSTIEFWIYRLPKSGTYQCIFSTANDRNNFIVDDTNTLIITSNGGTTLFSISADTYIPFNTWMHVALNCSGTTWTLYFNGTAYGTYSGADKSSYSSGTAQLGARNDMNGCGYLSNFRISNIARYSGNFTPPTAPFVSDSNTKMLTCQSNNFIDTSSSAQFLTVNNNSLSIERFNPFGISTAYSTSVIGGSMYSPNANNYVSFSPSSTFAFGTGDFTVEGWFYSITNSSFGIFDSTTNGSYWALRAASGGGQGGQIFYQSASGITNALTINSAFAKNTWVHVALVRSSGTSTIYVNGVSAGSVSDTTNYTATTTYQSGTTSDHIVYGNNSSINGYICDARVVKGTAVYTANFTPPTAPLTAVSGTSVLLSNKNAGIFDNAMMNNLETVGNAQISTSVKKYGTGSLAFDGTTDYLQAPTNQIYAFGTGNFTIEFWVYANSWTTTASTVVRIAGASDWVCQFDGSGVMNFYANGAAQLVDSGSPSTGVWTHYAIVRSGTSLKMYRSGTSVASATYATSIGASNVLLVGCGGDSNNTLYCLNGYIDELRITKGYARYTATFTPPTAALPDTGPY